MDKMNTNINESREYKAAEALTDALNTMSWLPKKFAMSVALQHRTLQQELARTMVATIRVMGSDDYGYDDRNRGSHETAKKIVASGILDDIYLPFI